jgi:hypothetical protein
MVGVGESIEDGGRMGNRESGRVTRKKKVDESETVSEVFFERSLQLAASQMGFNGWARLACQCGSLTRSCAASWVGRSLIFFLALPWVLLLLSFLMRYNTFF